MVDDIKNEKARMTDTPTGRGSPQTGPEITPDLAELWEEVYWTEYVWQDRKTNGDNGPVPEQLWPKMEAERNAARAALIAAVQREKGPEGGDFTAQDVADFSAALAGAFGDRELMRRLERLLLRIRAAVQSAATPLGDAPKSREYYLIEAQKADFDGAGPRAWWWSGHRANNEDVWTTESHLAVQFCRREDAENTLRIFRWYQRNSAFRYEENICVTGHMDILVAPDEPNASSRPAPSGSGTPTNPRQLCECGAAFEEHDGRPFVCGNFTPVVAPTGSGTPEIPESAVLATVPFALTDAHAERIFVEARNGCLEGVLIVRANAVRISGGSTGSGEREAALEEAAKLCVMVANFLDSSFDERAAAFACEEAILHAMKKPRTATPAAPSQGAETET